MSESTERRARATLSVLLVFLAALPATGVLSLLARAGTPPGIGTAPVVIVFVADLARALAVDGVRGYRYALVDAGVLGGNLYLEAGARGAYGPPAGYGAEPRPNCLATSRAHTRSSLP